jgi:hypothetical protein
MSELDGSTPAVYVEAVAGLAPHEVLALEHDPRHVAQGRLKIVGILLADLLLRHDVVLRAVAGVDGRHGVVVARFRDGDLVEDKLLAVLLARAALLFPVLSPGRRGGNENEQENAEGKCSDSLHHMVSRSVPPPCLPLEGWGQGKPPVMFSHAVCHQVSCRLSPRHAHLIGGPGGGYRATNEKR